MNNICFEVHHLKIEPSAQEPEWAALVERWYQLDKSAFALAEAYWQMRSELCLQPRLLLLASPGASNQTDFKFVEAKLHSASKFVHTLPNVRGTSLYQIMGWFGPMLCLQNGNKTILSALAEAIDEYQASPKEIWLFSVNQATEQATEVYLFRFGKVNLSPHNTKIISGAKTSGGKDAKVDSDLCDWLRHSDTRHFSWNDIQLERVP